MKICLRLLACARTKISLFEDVGGSHLVIPVYARQEMIGFLGCHCLASSELDLRRHLQVLEVIVGILGSALLREEVLETLDQRIAARTRELATFFDLTTLAIGTQDLPDMLDPVPGRILELGSCDAMCIHLLDAGENDPDTGRPGQPASRDAPAIAGHCR